ncbi:MAG TPA: F0F1 ATP synthase subunit delta [Microbacteriaceae bacterium]|nr:F0F1 ATP synthase subunit delta [Microbacteriaceae bacterium]
MGSATRHAMTAAVGAIKDLDGVDIEVARQVFGVGRVIASSRALRGVLADASVPGEAKEALVHKLLPDFLEPRAGRVVGVALGQRWSHDDDLVSGLEELGVRLAAEAGDAERVQRELFSFGRAVASSPALELALDDKVGQADEKITLIDALLAGRASEASAVILREVVGHARGRSARSAIESAARVVADERGQVVATVTVAATLPGRRREGVAAHLARQYGRDVTVNYVIDPAIVGGMRIRVGDEVIDGTVTSKLTDARLKLAG